jgi:predicted ATP-grasp superfamily ATP-dependent carboligase
MLGTEVKEKRSFDAGVKWIELIPDISVSRMLIRERCLTWREWLKSFTGKKVYAIFAWDDPLPFLRLFCSAMFDFIKERV